MSASKGQKLTQHFVKDMIFQALFEFQWSTRYIKVQQIFVEL